MGKLLQRVLVSLVWPWIVEIRILIIKRPALNELKFIRYY